MKANTKKEPDKQKEIMAELPISEDIKGALLGEQSQFREVYDLALAYERAEWKIVTRRAAELGIEEGEIPDIYRAALEWADENCGL